jgi:hypothetical protein
LRIWVGGWSRHPRCTAEQAHRSRRSPGTPQGFCSRRTGPRSEWRCGYGRCRSAAGERAAQATSPTRSKKQPHSGRNWPTGTLAVPIGRDVALWERRRTEVIVAGWKTQIGRN